MASWFEYQPGKHDTSRLFTEGRTPFFFVPTRHHPKGLSGHLPKHAAERNPLYGPEYSGRR